MSPAISAGAAELLGGGPRASSSATRRKAAIKPAAIACGSRWLNPSTAQGVMARTDIPVSVFARGRPGMLERFAVPAGLAALLLTGE